MTDIPEDVMKLAANAEQKFHSASVTPQSLSEIIAAAILADREARKAEPVISGDSLIARLERHTRRILPTGWKNGLKCPECGADANRQKCMWDMGGGCPRHDPDSYEPTPYIDKPDEDVQAAIARIRSLEAEKAELLEGLSSDRKTARRHVVELRQRSIFAADVGPSTAKAMKDAADWIESIIAKHDTQAKAAPAQRREINDEREILTRLAGGDRIVFSQDGDMAWFTEGDRAFVGDVIMEMREKGLLSRRCDDEENYRGLSEYDTISDKGRAALAKHGGGK